MRKIISAVVLICLVLTLFTPIMAQDAIKIILDGNILIPKDANGNVVEPFIENGSTFLPLRALSEALGFSVSWDDATKTVYIGSEPAAGDAQNDGKVKIYIDGKRLEPRDALGNPVEPVLRDGTTYLPVRAISEAFGKRVDWDGTARTVSITSGTVSEGLERKYFYIINKATGKALAPVGYGIENSVKFTLADKEENDGQIWFLSYADKDTYFVSNKLTGKVLDIPASSNEDGKALAQWGYNGGKNQQWIITKSEDGSFTIISKLNGFALELKDGVIVQTKAKDSDTQKWELIFAGDSVLNGVLKSEGYKTLPENIQRGFSKYVLGSMDFSKRVADAAERLLASSGYEKQDAERQRQLIVDTLSLTAYGQVTGGILNQTSAKYKITGVTVEDNYDIWRGSRTKVWIHDVEMEGDVPGQIHKFKMVSNEEETTVVEDAIQALGMFPYAFRHWVNRVIWKAGDNANNYNGGGDTIWIRLNYTPKKEQISQVFAHELGHVLDSNTLPRAEVWTRAIAADAVAVSGYGSSNQAEDLAEFSRIFWFNRGRETESLVDTIYPNRSTVFKGLLYRSDNEYFKDYKVYSDKIDEMVSEIEKFGSDSDAGKIDITKYYKIVDKKTGKVMSTKDPVVKEGATPEEIASARNNIPVDLVDYTGEDNQIFAIEKYGNLIKFVNKKSGIPLQFNTSYLNGKPLVQYGGQWAVNDKFAPYEQDGGFVFISLRTGLGIAAYDGAARSYYEPTVWELVPVGEAARVTYYRIGINNKVLTGDGRQLTLEDDTGKDNQVWMVREESGGCFMIINKESGYVLDVSGASMDPGAGVLLWDSTKADNQLFKLTKTSKGMLIQAKHSSLYVTAGETKFTQEPLKDNSSDQLFVFTEIK